MLFQRNKNNPFLANALILYLLKTENQSFSDVFSG